MSTPVLREKPSDARFSPRTRNLFGFNFVSHDDVSTIVDHIAGPQPADEMLPFVLTPNVDYIVRLRESGMADLAEVLPQCPLRAARRPADRVDEPFHGRAPRRPPARQHDVPCHVEAGRRRAPAHRRHRVERDDRRSARARSTPRPACSCRRSSTPTTRRRSPTSPTSAPPCVRDTRAEFVFVGISFPKQQRVALAVTDLLRDAGEHVPLFLLLGGSFEMYLGQVKRAPKWMQRFGLEWFFRFVQEPRRLFKRYFVTDTRFAWLCVRELVRSRTGRRSEFA